MEKSKCRDASQLEGESVPAEGRNERGDERSRAVERGALATKPVNCGFFGCHAAKWETECSIVNLKQFGSAGRFHRKLSARRQGGVWRQKVVGWIVCKCISLKDDPPPPREEIMGE